MPCTYKHTNITNPSTPSEVAELRAKDGRTLGPDQYEVRLTLEQIEMLHHCMEQLSIHEDRIFDQVENDHGFDAAYEQVCTMDDVSALRVTEALNEAVGIDASARRRDCILEGMPF